MKRGQHWDLFNYDDRGILDLQKVDDDDEGLFSTDNEALVGVYDRAFAGDKEAILALKELVDSWITYHKIEE